MLTNVFSQLIKVFFIKGEDVCCFMEFVFFGHWVSWWIDISPAHLYKKKSLIIDTWNQSFMEVEKVLDGGGEASRNPRLTFTSPAVGRRMPATGRHLSFARPGRRKDNLPQTIMNQLRDIDFWLKASHTLD